MAQKQSIKSKSSQVNPVQVQQQSNSSRYPYGSPQRELLYEADSIIRQLDACETILDFLGRLAYDDQQISGYILQGLGDVLVELIDSIKRMKGTIETLDGEPVKA